MPALQREYVHRKTGGLWQAGLVRKKNRPQSGTKARFHSLFPKTQCGGSGKRCDVEALFCPGDMVQALAYSDVLHLSPHSVEKGRL